jgi:hypothetical protein
MKGAELSLPWKQQSRFVSAQAGTRKMEFYFLDYRLRGKDALAVGRRTAGCFIRLKWD